VQYQKAFALAPNDPTPLSNLSSIKFEQGQYRIAVEYILKSLSLASTKDAEADEAALRRKRTLYERLTKCYMHESRFDEAGKIVDEIADEKLKKAVRSTLDALTAWTSSAKNLDEYRRTIFERLPRFQAPL
jgi:Flp pilus assembly protein TadD